MKKTLLFAGCLATLVACKQKGTSENGEENKTFSSMCEQYYQDGLKMDPLSATFIGDERYNDLLPNDGSQEYIKASKAYNERYLDSLKKYDRAGLNRNDQLSYDYLKDKIDVNLEGFKYHPEYLPFNQMFALPLTIGQLGSGTGAQPFKTVKDYEDWLKRVSAFSLWADTAIGNFKKEQV